MKINLNYMVLAGIGLLLLTAASFIPISSKPTGCGSDQRYSIIFGQLDEYNQANTRVQSIFEGVCANYGNHKLFLL